MMPWWCVPLISLSPVAVFTFLYWRDRRKEKQRDAHRLGLPEDRAPHVVQMGDGRYAVRRWGAGYWELYGHNFWWTAVGYPTGRQWVHFCASATEAWAHYQESIEARAAKEVRDNDVGVKVQSTND